MIKNKRWLPQKEWDKKNWEKKLGKVVNNEPTKLRVYKDGKLIWNF